MRASPAFQVSVTRFGFWRAGVLAIIGVSAGALAAWLTLLDDDVSALLRVAALFFGAALLAWATTLLRIGPTSLRWDAQSWHLGPVSSRGEEPLRGQLVVAVDLGPWMLLKFRREGDPRFTAVTWLPVQRRGLEPHWHALRCAVYCPRPIEGLDGSETAVARPESQE